MKMHLKSGIVAAVALALVAGPGCQSDTGNGALIGGGLGAVAGGIIGHQSGHAAAGALIGGGLGAGGGALIGNASDRNKAAKRDAYERGYYEGNRDGRREPVPAGGYYESRSYESYGPGGRRSSYYEETRTTRRYDRGY